MNEKLNDAKSTYPKGYFKLFGSTKDLDIEEPNDIDIKLDEDIEACSSC